MTLYEASIVAIYILVLASSLFGVSKFANFFDLAPELKRKMVHVGIGLSVLTLPTLFDRSLPVIVLCIVSLAILVMARYVKAMGSALHDVSRKSLGDIWFGIAVIALFMLAEKGARVSEAAVLSESSRYIFFILPILIMTLADTAAALTGTTYGKKIFKIENGQKSIEGVGAFFIVTWMVSLFVLLLGSNVPKADAILISMIVALVGASIEAESWGGLDNIFVPFGIHVVLVALISTDTYQLVQTALLFLVMLAVSLRFNSAYGRQPIRAAIIVLMVTWIAFSPIDFLLVSVAMAMTLAANRDRANPEKFEDLHTVFAIVILALIWVIIGTVVGRNMIMNFSVAISIYGAVMATLALYKKPLAVLSVIALIGLILMGRLLVEGSHWGLALARVLAGGLGVTFAVLIGFRNKEFFREKRSIKTLLISMAISSSLIFLE